MTQDDILALLAASPLQRAFDPPAEIKPRRPPLPLSPGHVALMLVSGQLDGVVESDEPHVARGIEARDTFVREDSESTDEKGTRIHKVVQTTCPKPRIRAAYQDGRIVTYE